jgi:hypothetical protein
MVTSLERWRRRFDSGHLHERDVAQQRERTLGERDVVGASPTLPTTIADRSQGYSVVAQRARFGTARSSVRFRLSLLEIFTGCNSAVEGVVRNHEAAGANPAIPTTATVPSSRVECLPDKRAMKVQVLRDGLHGGRSVRASMGVCETPGARFKSGRPPQSFSVLVAQLVAAMVSEAI